MKKFSRLFLSGMLVTILGFGLAGCGSQKNSKDTASSSHTKTEKVTKKATKKTSKNSKQNSTKKTSSTSSSASVTSSSQSSSSTANSNVNNNSQKQLGLNDVAVRTDQYGVTHHVDSDGMYRQTISGSSQTNYQDWSGSLPSTAQIVHQS